MPVEQASSILASDPEHPIDQGGLTRRIVQPHDTVASRRTVRFSREHPGCVRPVNWGLRRARLQWVVSLEGDLMRVVGISQKRRLEILDLPSPRLEPDQVRIRVRFCGICGSDLHMRCSPTVPAGVVMGHEFMGVIEELGAEVSGWAVGDRVVVNPLEPCGVCTDCTTGSPELCLAGISGGIGLGSTYGAYAETVVARQSRLFRLPSSISDEHGALVEPLAVGMHAVRIASPTPDARCAVLGAGPIGILTAIALRFYHCKNVLVIEPLLWRRRTAYDAGFLVSPSDTDDSAVSQLGGRPTFVFDCSGHPTGLPSAMALAESGGRVVVVGITATPSSVPSAVLVSKALRIFGSLAYTDSDFASAIDCLESDVVRGRLITTVARLDQAQHWFDDLSSGATRQVKVLLQP
jgi:(R,R)-butanediol dehydrogenase/meso-butanediol dehydrogenase/diacetyl reductase